MAGKVLPGVSFAKMWISLQKLLREQTEEWKALERHWDIGPQLWPPCTQKLLKLPSHIVIVPGVLQGQ